MWLDRRHRFAGGQVFGLYLMAYTAGRSWIEMLRIDDAHTVLGLRLNVWTSVLVFALGALLFVIAGRMKRPTRVVADDVKDPDAARDEDASLGEDAGEIAASSEEGGESTAIAADASEDEAAR